jgi:hypothetical protein
MWEGQESGVAGWGRTSKENPLILTYMMVINDLSTKQLAAKEANETRRMWRTEGIHMRSLSDTDESDSLR